MRNRIVMSLLALAFIPAVVHSETPNVRRAPVPARAPGIFEAMGTFISLHYLPSPKANRSGRFHPFVMTPPWDPSEPPSDDPTTGPCGIVTGPPLHLGAGCRPGVDPNCAKIVCRQKPIYQ